MKTLNSFVKESLTTTSSLILFKANAKTIVQASKIEDKLRQFCKFGFRKKPYSFSNKDDMNIIYKHFVDMSGIQSNVLKEFGLKNSKDLAELLVDNIVKIKNAGWSFDSISTLDDTELEKEYKKWRKSKDYVKGKPFRSKIEKIDEPEEAEVRTLVIYDANFPGNPDTTLEYEFVGKRNDESKHRINMMKMDWRFATGLKYFDARVCFYTYYISKSDEELRQREFSFDNSDLY